MPPAGKDVLVRSLFIVAGLFFAIFGGLIAYFATSDPGNEYDLTFVLPVDARQMPATVLPPPVAPAVQSEGNPPAENPATRADAGQPISTDNRTPFRFEDRQPAATEMRAHE